MNFPPPHIILGVDANANETEIKKKYQKLIKIYHPDKYTGNTPNYANEQFIKIQKAKQVMLSDEYKKKNKNNMNNNSQCFFHTSNVNRRNFQHQTLNNGTVLLSGNFRPSQMTYDIFKNISNQKC